MVVPRAIPGRWWMPWRGYGRFPWRRMTCGPLSPPVARIARSRAWCCAARAIHSAVQLHDDLHHAHPAPVAAPDADAVAGALLDAGAEVALLTGNLEQIGRTKVAAAGLGHRFGPGGGFGSDAEVRADLVGIARGRAARAHDDHDVVVVGDTPRDIAAARAAGVRVVAVTTGAHDARALAGADHVVPGLTAALAVLQA